MVALPECVDAKEFVMADSSFDIVSKADRQEVDNALNQRVRGSSP